MAGLLDLFGAFKAGQEIADPAKWKNIDNLAKSLGVVLSAGVVLYRMFVGALPVTDEQLIAISGGLATLLMTFSNIVTTITTKKNVSLIGLPDKEGKDGA